MSSVIAAAKPSVVAAKLSQSNPLRAAAVGSVSFAGRFSQEQEHLSQNRNYYVFCRSQPSSASATSFSSKNTTKNGWEINIRQEFSSNKRDFYDVLGIPKTADKGAIKKAYFKLAKQYHPDTNQGDKAAGEKFKEATEAYETLSDEKQRELYDQFGHAGVDPNSGFGGGGGGFSGNPFEGFEGFQGGGGGFNFHFSGGQTQFTEEDVFDMMFGSGRSRQRGPRRGSDMQTSMEVTFKEAVFGSTKDMKYRYQYIDNKTGQVEVKEKEVSVDIPPGMSDGMNLSLAGQGPEGDPGAPRGNLIIQILVQPDPEGYFHRDGFDVHTEVPISLTQAVLGGTVDVKTLTGDVEMKIPKGCQVETKLMMRGKGIQRLQRPGKGNQIVHLKIQIPKEITSRQEEILREFDEETRVHGMGISGRLARAAGSAFETLFGKKDCEAKDNENEASEDATEDLKGKGKDDDDDAAEKKTAAQ